MTNDHNGSGLGVSLATAGVATAASLLPQLTEWVRFAAAVVGLVAALIAFWKAYKK